MKYLIPILLFSVVFFSCGKDEVEPPITDLGYEYFPLEIGKYKEYRMDSTFFDGQIVRRNSSSYLREEIVSMDMDLENEEIYIINVSRKSTLSDPWVQTGVVVEKRNARSAERLGDNLRFIKLIFPLRNGSSWDGNAFISPDLLYVIEGEPVMLYTGWSDKYQVIEDPISLTIDQFVFDNAISVLESDEGSITSLRESMATYAPNVGLVKRSQRLMGLECNGEPDNPCYNPNNPWEDQAESGYSLSQTIIDYN